MIKKMKNSFNFVNDDDDIPLKKVTTAVICYSNFALGIISYTIGPTLMDLMVIYETSMDKLSMLFATGAMGYTVGSLCGVIYKYINRQLMISYLLIQMGLALAMYPHGNNILVLYACAIILSFSAGGIEAGQNVWIMEMWQKRSSPILQVARFACGLGAIVGPLLVKPFITGDLKHDQNLTNIGHNMTYDGHNTTNGTNWNDGIDRVAKLTLPYAINGGFCVIAGVMMFVLYCIKKYKPPPASVMLNPKRPKSQISSRSTKGIVALGAIFIGFYGIMEVTMFQFISAFSHYSPVHFTEPQGDELLLVMSVSYVIAKVIFIPIAIKVSPQKILCFTLSLIMVGYVMLVCASHSDIVLWVSAVVMGIGFSATFPTIFAYLEQYLVMTNKKGTIFIFTVGCVGSIVPIIVGKYVVNHSIVLIFAEITQLGVCFAAFLIIYLIVRYNTGDKHVIKHEIINNN